MNISIKERILKILDILLLKYPNQKCRLNVDSEYQFFIAVCLSARYQDNEINKLVPKILNIFHNFDELSNANEQKLYQLIKDVTYAEVKAKNLILAAQIIKNKFQNKIPQNLIELESLPSVGRKSANMILAELYNIPAIPIDTHIQRIFNRLTSLNYDTSQIERTLYNYIDKEKWIISYRALTNYGKEICKSDLPLCNNCIICELCKKKSSPKEHKQLTIFDIKI